MNIHNMKLHDIEVVSEKGGTFNHVMRVPCGWIYTFLDKGHNIHSSTFVPFGSEFMVHESEQDSSGEGL